MQPDYLGVDGGRLAMAFASGCVATFAFTAAIGGFIWQLIGKSREYRIKDLRADLVAEKERCAEMERRLVDRIQQLETLLIFETAGNVRQGAQLAITEIRREVEARVRSAAQEKDGVTE